MVERGDDPPSNSGDNPQTPRQSDRRLQESSHGEFRTLGMKLLNSARQHIRRYSAAANQPVAPLPSSWRAGASEPLVWSESRNSATESSAIPPVESVEAYLARQATRSAAVAPLPTANPPGVQRHAEPTPTAQASPAAPPPAAPPAVVQRQAAPTKAAIAQAQRQQLLKIMEIHEGRAVREAFERGESPAAAGSLFSEEAINERMGRGKPKPKTTAQQSITDNPETGVARTPRRRGAIIEVTTPIKQPFEDMEWENNSGDEDSAGDQGDLPLISAAESPSFPDTNTPPVQRQAYINTSPAESEPDTDLSPSTIEAGRSASEGEAPSLQRQDSSGMSLAESEPDIASSLVPLAGRGSTSPGETPPLQREAYADRSPIVAEPDTASLSITGVERRPSIVSDEPSVQRRTSDEPSPIEAETGMSTQSPSVTTGESLSVSVSDAPLVQRRASNEPLATEAEMDTATFQGGELPLTSQNVDTPPIPLTAMKRGQIARETAEPGDAPSVSRAAANESSVHERPEGENSSGASIARASTASPEKIEPIATSDADVTRMADEDIDPDPFEDRAAFAFEVPAEPGMDSAALPTSASSTTQYPAVEPSESILSASDGSRFSSPEINIQRKAALEPANQRSTPIQDTEAQSRLSNGVNVEAPANTDGQTRPAPAAEIQRQLQDTQASLPNAQTLERASFVPPTAPLSNEQPSTTIDDAPRIVDVYPRQDESIVRRDVVDKTNLSASAAGFEASEPHPIGAAPVSDAPNPSVMTDGDSPNVQSQTSSTDSIAPVIQRQSAPILPDAPNARSAMDQLSNADTEFQPGFQGKTELFADAPAPEVSRQSGLDVSDSIQRAESGGQSSAVETAHPSPVSLKKGEAVVDDVKSVDYRPSVAHSESELQVQRKVASSLASEDVPSDFSSDMQQRNASEFHPDSGMEMVPNRMSPTQSEPVSPVEGQSVQRASASETNLEALNNPIPPLTSVPHHAASTPVEVQAIQRVTDSETVSEDMPTLSPPAAQLSASESGQVTTLTDAIIQPPVSVNSPTVQRSPASEVVSENESNRASFDAEVSPSESGRGTTVSDAVVQSSVSVNPPTIQRTAISEIISEDRANFSLSAEQVLPFPVITQPSTSINPSTLQRAVTGEFVSDDVPTVPSLAAQILLSESERTATLPDGVIQPPTSNNPPTIQRVVTGETVPEDILTLSSPAAQILPSESGRATTVPDVVVQQPVSDNLPTVQRSPASEVISEDATTLSSPAAQILPSDVGREAVVPERMVQPPASINLPPIQRAMMDEGVSENTTTLSPSAAEIAQPESGRGAVIPDSPLPAIAQPPNLINPPTVQRAATREDASEDTTTFSAAAQNQPRTISEPSFDSLAHQRPISSPESQVTPDPMAASQPKTSFDTVPLIQREANGSPEIDSAESAHEFNDMNVFEALLSIGAVKPITASRNIVRRQSDSNQIPEPSNTTPQNIVGSNSDFEQAVYEADSPEADLLRMLDLSPDTPVVRRKQGAAPLPSEGFSLRNEPEAEAAEIDPKIFQYPPQPHANAMPSLQRSADTGTRPAQAEQVSASEAPHSQPVIQRLPISETVSRVQTPATDVISDLNDLDIAGDEGVNLEEVSRQVYHMLQQRLRVERERRGRL